jgi:hypothetical protein
MKRYPAMGTLILIVFLAAAASAESRYEELGTVKWNRNFNEPRWNNPVIRIVDH